MAFLAASHELPQPQLNHVKDSCPQPTPAHTLVSGQRPHSLSAGCHSPSLPCQGKGTSLHILPNLSPQHKLNTCTGRVLRSIPWMDWNWSRLGSTYVWCCIPHFWERCNQWWETAVGVVSDTSWEAPSPGCGVAATWAQGELCGAARRPGPCSREGCLALSKCKRMRQGKTQVFVLVPREKDITVHLVLPLVNIKWENKVKCNCYASMVVPFLQWGMKALMYINDCKRCRGELCAKWCRKIFSKKSTLPSECLNFIYICTFIHSSTQRARPVDTISTIGKKLVNQLNTLLNLSKGKKN